MDTEQNNRHELTQFTRAACAAIAGFVSFAVLATVTLYVFVGEPPVAKVEAPFLIAKEQMVHQQASVNTVFIGSSVTFRQINPEEFDRVAQTVSFNLGNPGLYPMRSVDYLEHLVDEPPPGVSTVFFELFRLDPVTYNYKSPEIMHSLNARRFTDVLGSVAAANFPANYKVYLAAQYARAMAFKYLGFGLFDYMSIERELRPLDRERLNFASRGFLAKDTEIVRSADAVNVEKISAIGERFLGQGDLLERRRLLHSEKYNKEWQLHDSPYLENLRNLIERAEAKGIRLIYVLPPLLTNRGIYFAYPVYRQLPEANRLDLSDPAEYPELYLSENLFDLEHVNSKGAVKLSRYLAEAFVDMAPPLKD